VCISDTHNCHSSLAVPLGDVLIHSGDATINGTEEEILTFSNWFRHLPHRRKIFVAGNHDRLFEDDLDRARQFLGREVVYLQDCVAAIDGLRIYGSPWQPRFFDWAFNRNRGPEMAEVWSKIPADIDILITHGPPFGILDEVERPGGMENAGCEELLRKIAEIIHFGRLRLHIFGHIHAGHGTKVFDDMTFVNASICDEEYRPIQKAIVVEL
ncbi:MAG: metallophosphoesterase, partial [Blastocatellia bacterium]